MGGRLFGMKEMPALTDLTEQERADALHRFQLIQPFLGGRSTLKAVTQEQNIPYRTARRWVSRYRRFGLVGLVRKRRRDRNQRRMEPELQLIIEGLALQKAKPSAAVFDN